MTKSRNIQNIHESGQVPSFSVILPLMKISSGTIHTIPPDLKKLILSEQALTDLWESLTPLARNEWICWIEDAKKPETRQRRLELTVIKMLDGKRRPCCWAGCPHR